MPWFSSVIKNLKSLMTWELSALPWQMVAAILWLFVVWDMSRPMMEYEHQC